MQYKMCLTGLQHLAVKLGGGVHNAKNILQDCLGKLPKQ